MKTLVLELVVDQVVPADLDLGLPAREAGHQERLVKVALLEGGGDMLGDVVWVREEVEAFPDGSLQLLLVLFFLKLAAF